MRREGRITPAQTEALQRLWPRFGIDEGDGALEPAALFGRRAPLVVEIGFGAGHHLLASAQARSFDIDWDKDDKVFLPWLTRPLAEAKAAGDIDKLDLPNLRVLCQDAVQVLRQRLPAGAADEVVIFFPDPWPKKRHHKRRLIQPEFARVLAHTLRPGGRLRLATDWADYARHMLEVLEAEPAFANLAGPGNAMPRPDDRPLTRFEARGLRLGHAVADFEYRRV